MGLTKQGEIDGVPCFWVEAEGPLTAGLVFGVGTSDEPFANRGITHLIEHLALHDVPTDLRFNGAVDMRTTTLHCRGSVEEVRIFFEQVLAGLSNLPYDQLERECRVLAAEANQRNEWSGSAALHVIYGARGPGVTATPEAGLWNTTAERVDAWRRRNFVRQNAVAFFHGPAPAGISFAGLADGPPVSRRPLPASYIHEPSYMYLRVAGPAMYAPQARGVGSLVCSHAGSIRLNERLRNDRGISYGVQGGAADLDPETQLISVAADATAEHSTEAFDLMRIELQRLADEGPSTDEVDRYLTTHLRAAAEPEYAMDELVQRARHHLEGRPFVELAAAVEQIRSMTTDQLVAPFRAAMGQALWLIPGSTEVRDVRLTPIASSSEVVADGPDHACAYTNRVLRVDDEMLSLGTAEQKISVRHGAIVGATQFTDGAWTFWGEDGFVLSVQPSDFDAEDEVGRFVARLPPELVTERGLPYRSADEQATLQPKVEPKTTLRDKFRARKVDNARKRRDRKIVPVDRPARPPEWSTHLGHPGAIAFTDAILAGNWPLAERHFVQQDTDADRQHLLNTTRDMDATPDLVRPWVEGAANVGLPLLVRGMIGIGWAWHARTSARAGQVSAAMFEEFHGRLVAAERDLLDASSELADSPFPWTGLLTSGRGLQIPAAELEDRYVAHVERGATLSGHQQYLQSICEKWGGSHEQMWAHTNWLVDQAEPGSTALGVAPIAFAEHLISRGRHQDPVALLAELGVAPLLTEAARKSYGSTAFPVHRIDAASTLSQFFTYCWLTRQFDVASSLVPMIGERFSDFPMSYFSTGNWQLLKNQVSRHSA